MNEFLEKPELQKVQVLSENPQEGPDGFPYMLLSTEGGSEPFLNLVQWGGDRGIGLAINPQKETPDFVFTYGMLWNFKVRGEFITLQSTRTDLGDFLIKNQQSFFAGAPSEAYWPEPQRKIFREFLLQQGILQAKIIMLSEKKEGPMDLVFSWESLGQPPQEELAGLLEAFSWFFPRHYSLLILSEKNINGVDFLPL